MDASHYLFHKDKSGSQVTKKSTLWLLLLLLVVIVGCLSMLLLPLFSPLPHSAQRAGSGSLSRQSVPLESPWFTPRLGTLPA